MEVKKDDIAKDLRFVASVYNIVMKPFKLQVKEPKKKTIEVKKPKSMGPVKSIYIPRKDESGLRLLVIDSKKRKSRMGVLWIHGGGYVNGFPEMAFITMAKEISKKCLVVSPSYRLASSYPYPAALEDCYTTLLWMHDHADELGIDKDKIAVGGESAGGGLTVALCLLARDRKEVNVMLQMPIYPMLDCRSDTKSMEDNNAPVWNEKSNIEAWNIYLRDIDKDNVPYYASPALCDNYAHMPPCISFVGDIEPFRDETVTYINRLKEVGIPTDFAIFNGCYHGFDIIAPGSKEAKEEKQFFINALDKYL